MNIYSIALICNLFFIFQIFDDHYHFHHHELRKRSVEPSHHHQTRLNDDNRVRWSKQQRIKSRKKRDFLSFHEPKSPPYPITMGKNRVLTSDPKWPQMWYLVSLSINSVCIFFCYVVRQIVLYHATNIL